MTSQDAEGSNKGGPIEEPGKTDLDGSEPTEVEGNNAVSKAWQEAHLGNVRCVLSSAPKKKQTIQVKFAQWSEDTEWYNTSEGENNLDELLGDYDWDPDDEQDFHYGNWYSPWVVPF